MTTSSSRPIPASRPAESSSGPSRASTTNGSVRSGSNNALKPLNSAHRVTKPSAPSRSTTTTATTPTNASTSSGGAAPAAARAAPPKKGSYAEVLARAKKAQEAMGQVGRIQHKKSEKKDKEKEMPQKPDPRTPGKKPSAGAAAPSGSAARSTGYQGTGKGGATPRPNGANGGGMRNGTASRDERGRPMGGKQQGMTEKERKAAAAAQELEEKKKMRKAAQATTGYTGTARPKPGATTKNKDKAPRGGALLNSAPQRHSGYGRRSSYEDDYDEDMDDFIDYDDEEDDQLGGGPRYHYDSDGSSDMEAGVDDLEGEERRAELIARREDIEEERIERGLKAAKEDRKRKALEALRSKNRR